MTASPLGYPAVRAERHGRTRPPAADPAPCPFHSAAEMYPVAAAATSGTLTPRMTAWVRLASTEESWSLMQLENEFSVPAPVSEVWKTLLDVERIAPCPVLGGLAFGLVLGLLLGHRRRIVIMTAAAPGSYPPARTVL